MSPRPRLTGAAAFLLALVAAPQAAPRPTAPEPDKAVAGPPRLDFNGERLPPGAVSRVGTTRFRHGSDINDVAFAPDGRTAYTASFDDKLARAWAVTDGRELYRFGGEAGVSSVAVSPDGKLVATGEGESVVRIWDAASGQEVRRIALAAAANVPPRQVRNGAIVRWVRFAPDGKSVRAAYTLGNAVVSWDVATGKDLGRGPAEDDAARSLSGDGKRLAVAGVSRARVVDAATGQAIQTVTLSNDPNNSIQVTAVALTPDGKLLVTAGSDRSVRFWDVESGKELRQTTVPTYATAFAFAPNGATLALAYETSDESGVVALIDPATAKEWRRVDGQVRGTQALAFSPDGKTLATGGAGHTLRLWDVATGKETSAGPGHPGAITTVAVSPDGRLLATCSVHDKLIRLWDTATGREVRVLEGHTTGVDEVTFSPDGRLLASAAWDQPVLVWEVATGRLLHTLRDHAALGPYLRFADDGTTLATGSHANTIALWDCTTGKLVRELSAPPNGVSALLTFHDGRLLAYEHPDPDDDNDASIALWDVTANRLVRRFTGHRGMVNGVILSPDGRMLASRGTDKTIRVWEVATGLERRRFTEPGQTQQAGRWTGTQFLAFAPDGRTLVTCATDDPFARRWDLTAGKELPPLAGHRSWVGAVEFSANGRTLVTGSQDTTALVWDGSAVGPPAAKAARRTEAELAALWDDLHERDGARSYRAIRELIGAGDQAAAFVADRLRPAPAADAAQIARWIESLDHPQFQVRERATAALLQVADQAEEPLRAALERTTSAEVRQRIRRVFDAARDVDPSPDRLRDLRAVEVLEGLAAREQLMALARGAAGAFVTREAQAALRRLELRGA